MRGPGLAVAGVGMGAALMYWMDPRSGRRRRHLLGDQAARSFRSAEQAVERGARDLSHRSRGRLYDTWARLRGEPVEDAVLVERVRSALGRVCSHPHALTVRASQGRVWLSGPLLAREHRPLLRRVRHVPGVQGVEDGLELHQAHERLPSLQGGREAPEPGGYRPRFWGSALGGAVLVGAGLQRDDVLRPVLGMAGGALWASALVRRGRRRAESFQKHLLIRAPLEDVYAAWSALERFPRFMRHVEEVRWLPEDQSHWRVRGPWGQVWEWDAALTERIPNRRLAWTTLPGAPLHSEGAVSFQEAPGGATHVDFRISALYPRRFAWGRFLLRPLFRRVIEDELLRFKSRLESKVQTSLRASAQTTLPGV